MWIHVIKLKGCKIRACALQITKKSQPHVVNQATIKIPDSIYAREQI